MATKYIKEKEKKGTSKLLQNYCFSLLNIETRSVLVAFVSAVVAQVSLFSRWAYLKRALTVRKIIASVHPFLIHPSE